MARRALHRAQQLQCRRLQRRGLLLARGKRRGLLRRNGEARHFFGLFARALRHIDVFLDQPPRQQIPQRRLKRLLIGKLRPQRRQVSTPAAILQRLHHGSGGLIARRERVPVAVFAQDGVGLHRVKPQPHGQDRVRRVIKRAEIPLTQKRCQMKLPRAQDRRGIQRPLHALERLPVALRHLQHDALAAAISPAERHDHPHPRCQRQRAGDFIGIGLVNGKTGGGNGDFCDHSLLPL